MNKVIKRQVVYVEWHDHWAKGAKWEKIKEDGIDGRLYLCKSVGWVINETKDSIFLSGSVSVDGDNVIDGYNGGICIAKKLIVKRINLKGVK